LSTSSIIVAERTKFANEFDKVAKCGDGKTGLRSVSPVEFADFYGPRHGKN
jgi:hypothetical protein